MEPILFRINKRHLTAMAVALAILFTPFLSFPGDGDPVVAQIGKHKIFKEEFIKILNQQKSNPEYSPKPEKIKQQLDMLIEKKVLINEAVQRDLALKKTFLKRVQSFWEQALILELLNAQGFQISQAVSVSEDEINAVAKKEGISLSSGKPYVPNIDAAINKIAERIKREKEAAALELWINQLVKSVDIKVNNAVLSDIIKEEYEQHK